MQLHQLLRYVHDNTPIIIFDLKDHQICSVRSKGSIDINLYEYDILDFTVGQSNIKGCNAALYITLEK